jgi:hypothetical protein
VINGGRSGRRTRGTSVDQWDAIIGINGRLGFGDDHNWIMPFYLDVGTGNCDLAWQAMRLCLRLAIPVLWSPFLLRVLHKSDSEMIGAG